VTRLVKFDPYHVDLIKGNLIHNDERLVAFDNEICKNAAIKYAENGLGFTCLDGGLVIGFGGVYAHWEGVGEVWCMLSDATEKHRLAIARTFLKGLQYTQGELRLHRVQATVRADNEVSIRLIKWLGFELESSLDWYGPNKELFYRYRKLFP
jgi:hypothetical protein